MTCPTPEAGNSSEKLWLWAAGFNLTHMALYISDLSHGTLAKGVRLLFMEPTLGNGCEESGSHRSLPS